MESVPGAVATGLQHITRDRDCRNITRSLPLLVLTSLPKVVTLAPHTNLRRRDRIRNIFSLSYPADSPGRGARRQLRFDEAHEFGGRRGVAHRSAGIGPRDVIRH